MQQQYDEIPQDSSEPYEAHDYHLASSQSQRLAQKSGIFIELRFAIALFSVIVLLAMSVVNMVIVRLFENVLYGLGAYDQGTIRLLFYTLPPLGMAILLMLLLVWINRFVGRQASNTAYSNPIGEKLVTSQPPSISQGLGLAFISLGLLASLFYTVTIYMRLVLVIYYNPYGTIEPRLAAIPILTAAVLAAAALWINIIFHTKQR